MELTKTPFASGSSLYGDGSSTTNPFGNTNSGGLYGAGRFSYSSNLTQSITTIAAVATASWAEVDFDSDYSASATGDELYKFSVATSSLDFVDKEGVSSFQFLSGSFTSYNSSVPGEQISQFTKYDGGANIDFFVLST